LKNNKQPTQNPMLIDFDTDDDDDDDNDNVVEECTPAEPEGALYVPDDATSLNDAFVTDASNPSFGDCSWTHWTKDECNSNIDHWLHEKDYQAAMVKHAEENLARKVSAGESTSYAKDALADAKYRMEDAKRKIRLWESRRPR
jgi:hypothetical protein